MLKRCLLPVLLLLALAMTLAAAADTAVLEPIPAVLQSVTATDLAAAGNVATPTELEDDSLLFSFVGDCTTGEPYDKKGYRSSYTYVVGKLGMDYPLSLVADLFAADDLTFANCEIVYTNRRPTKEAMALCAPAEWTKVLTLGNVDVVNMYNNHTLDFGERGRTDTQNALTAAGLGWSDKFIPWISEIKGVKIAMISLCSAMRKDQMTDFREKLVTLRQEGVNFIILSCHWGRQDNYKLFGDQLNAHEFLDMGVDMIWGHGSHTLQPVEYYNGKLIFYSTSNFTFGANGSPKDPDTAVFQVKFRINPDKTLTAAYLTVLPFRQGMNRDFRPYPLTEEPARQQCLDKVYATRTRASKKGSNLPQSFRTTGEVDLLAWSEELAAR